MFFHGRTLNEIKIKNKRITSVVKSPEFEKKSSISLAFNVVSCSFPGRPPVRSPDPDLFARSKR